MGAPQARLRELGEHLIDRGWAVEALTALPNYPGGRVFSGYSPFRPVVETIGRIRTVRVPLYASKTGFAKRLATYFSFAASSATLGSFMCVRPDLLFVESPPLFIGYAVRALSIRWRCPYVFNVSDLWPESALRMGIIKPGIASAMAERFELSMYRHAIGVTGQSSETVDSIRARVHGVRAEVITNGVEPGRFGREKATDDARSLLGRGEGPVFIYAGLFGWAQGLDQVLDVAKAIPGDVRCRFVLVGEGPEREKLESRLRDERISRVTLIGPQPRDRIPSLLAAADVAVVTLGMTIPGAVPSKIYEAMASGLPILLIADGEPALRVAGASAGLTASPGDVAGAVKACLRLAREPDLRERLGANGRRAAETTYNRAVIAERLDRFLRDSLPERHRGKAA